MAVRVRPSSRLISDDLPTLERPENATCGIPFVDSGCAWPICPMAPAKSPDLIRKGVTKGRGAKVRRTYEKRDGERFARGGGRRKAAGRENEAGRHSSGRPAHRSPSASRS